MTPPASLSTHAPPELGELDYVGDLAVYLRPAIVPSEGTVVLVHPAVEDASKFKRVVPLLEEYDVISYDRRGFGLSGGLAESMGDCVGDVASVVDYATSRTATAPTLVGICWGAAIGLTYLEQGGSEHVISGGFWEPLAIRRFWEGLYLQAALDCSQISGRDMVVVQAGGEYAWEAKTDAERSDLLRFADAAQSDGRLCVTDGLFSGLDDISVPCVVGLGGTSDFHDIETASKWFASELPWSYLIRMPDAGHLAHRTNPTRFAQFVRLSTPGRLVSGPPGGARTR